MWDIFVGIFTGSVLLMIERFLLPKESEKNEKVIEKVIEPERVVIEEKVVYVNHNKNSEDTDSFMWLMFFLGMAAVAGYIKYSNIVHSTIIIISTAVGIMAMGMAFFCMKKGMRFKKDLNLLLIINTLALVIVPWLINLTTKASEKQGINISTLKQEADLGNMFGSAELFDILFLLYQIIGLVSVIIYMISILISNFYLVSLININLGSKWSKIWSVILRKTYRLVSKSTTVVIFEGVFLFIGYLFVSGVLWNLIIK